MSNRIKFSKKNFVNQMKELGWLVLPAMKNCNKGDMRVFLDSSRKYYATVNIYNGKVTYNGKEYQDLAVLSKDIIEFAENQEFEPDAYNPDYDESWVNQLKIHSVLEKGGFRWFKNTFDDGNLFIAKGELGTILSKATDQSLLLDNDSFINFYENDEDITIQEKCAKIKSVLTLFYAVNLAKIAENIYNLGEMDKISSLKIKTINYNTMEISEKDGIDGISDILENVLSKIENFKERNAK